MTITACSPLVLRGDDGHVLPLDPTRWHGPATVDDGDVLAALDGPVLDVGCGPGRILEGLGRRGLPALGIDPAPGAVALARERGCAVLERSVFATLPGEGRWRTVLLLDGNVGIGGDPVRLLRRCRALMSADGVLLAEVEPPGVGWRTCRARLERGAEVGTWFAWSIVGADALDELAASAGLALETVQTTAGGRWFGRMRRVEDLHA
jgi:SAM-dependent methyltransferase